MRRLTIFLMALIMSLCFAGCSKKQQSLDELQQPMAPEDLSRIASAGTKISEQKTENAPESVLSQAPSSETAPNQAQGQEFKETKLENLPPAGPYKPSNQQIQTALKNAGLYTGLVDGKIGLLTRKAIEEFQKNNGLVVDGKVGPKTWSLLSKHLNIPEQTPVKPSKKKRR